MADSNTLTITLPEKEPHTSVNIQHGVRWPDGSITWSVHTTHDGINIEIAQLVPGTPEYNKGYGASNWERVVNRLADATRIDREVYREMLRFVQRTVIVATTAVEEVK